MNAIITFLTDHGYAWAKRIMYVAIILALWQLFVDPYVGDIQLIMLWWMNETIFKVMTEQCLEFIEQVMIFVITFRIIMWFFSSPDKDADDIPHASGFTSRRL